MRVSASPTKTMRRVRDIVEAAAGRIEDLAVRGGVERVHAEVAALGVFGPVLGESDGGAAAVGFDIAAQRGDFERLVIGDDSERAVLDAGGMHGDAGGEHRLLHLIRRELRRDVDVGDGLAQQRVAHAAADEARATGPRRVERGHHAPCCGGCHPGLGRQPAHGSAARVARRDGRLAVVGALGSVWLPGRLRLRARHFLGGTSLLPSMYCADLIALALFARLEQRRDDEAEHGDAGADDDQRGQRPAVA